MTPLTCNPTPHTLLHAPTTQHRTACLPACLTHGAAARSHQIYNLGINLSIGATIVHVALWHGRELYDAFAAHLCVPLSLAARVR